VDDWAGQSWNYCKPVAKYHDDREALREVIREGHPRFFLGSDSAPHPPHSKSTSTPSKACSAGIYTSPILLPLVVHLLEEFGALDKVEGFVSEFGRRFYRCEVQRMAEEGNVKVRKVLDKGGRKIEEKWIGDEEQSVVPFWAGKELKWEIVE
jgi:dihydroorotase